MLPANSTSPTKACFVPGSKNTTWPGVWPGQWRTCSSQPPMRTVSPSCSQRVGVKGSASGKPNMRLCCGSASIQNWSASCGPSMGRPSVRASVPVAPAWSMCACVSQICSSVRPSSFTAASSTSMSPPGSITAAWCVASSQTSEQFCWKGVTGMVRWRKLMAANGRAGLSPARAPCAPAPASSCARPPRAAPGSRPAGPRPPAGRRPAAARLRPSAAADARADPGR